MIYTHQFLSQFEDFFRGIVRDGIREAQLAIHPVPITPPNRLGDVNLAAEVTGFAKQTIYNLASKRRIPHSKRDGKLVFPRLSFVSGLSRISA